MINNADLLVIGNGFDLNCGLKSSFSDFFVSKIDDARLGAKTDSLLYNRTCQNIWYLLLYFSFYDDEYYDAESSRVFERIHKENLLWMDVEGFIKKVVAFDVSQDIWMKSHLRYENYCDALTSIFNNRNSSYIYGEKNQYSSLKKHFKKNEKNIIGKNIQEYLYSELLLFEAEFKEYLKNNILDSKDYKKDFDTIINQLIGQVPFSILTFNYTSVFDLGLSYSKLKGNYNVHGNLANKIIIGFDSSDIDSKFYHSIKLSKAWQKMNVTKTQYRLPKRGSISTIKFYGHSLGQQDYSYFHAIFDHFDIYNSDIKLIFYYTEYKDSEDDNLIVRTNYITSIFNLLNDYAFKSGNEEKVKTILSRLQLENRLIIETIPKIKKK